MIKCLVNQLRYCRYLNQTIILTTTSESDNVIESFCRREGLTCFRGSENDVLGRYFGAATRFKVDHIVRITADCPLIDPGVVDSVIEKHLEEQGDYTSNFLTATYPRGLDVEVFTMSALKTINKTAQALSEREHVTLFFYRHPELFKLISVEAPVDLRCPDLRLCVDEPLDLELIRAVVANLGQDPYIKFSSIITLFLQKPDLAKINSNVTQKTTDGAQ